MSWVTDWLGISAYARNKKLLGDYSREKHKLCMSALKKCDLPQVSLTKMMEDNQVTVIHDVPEELESKTGRLVFPDSLRDSRVLSLAYFQAAAHCSILSNVLGKEFKVEHSYGCDKDESGQPFAFYGFGINDVREKKQLSRLNITIS